MGRKFFAAIVAALFLYIASPLVFPVAMGAVIATLFFPWLERLERRKLSTGLASAFLTLVITLFVVLPSAILGFVGTREAFHQIQNLRVNQVAQPFGASSRGWVDAVVSLPRVHRILERITEWFPVHLQQLTETAQDLTRAGATRIAELLGELVTRLPGMLIAITVVVVSVYFFLIDGRKLVHFFRRNSVFSAKQTDHLFAALAGTCRSVILASVVSGAVQAIVEVIFCLSTGVPNAALIGIFVFLASFVPVIGGAPITLGVALHAFLLEQTGAGITLLIGAAVVMVLDNFIRPIFLKGSTNLHPLMAFVAAFGGLQMLGFSGVFLGPIVAAMFVATLQLLVHDNPKI